MDSLGAAGWLDQELMEVAENLKKQYYILTVLPYQHTSPSRHLLLLKAGRFIN